MYYNIAMNNLFLILGIVFLTIAVIGQSKVLFIEINPGFFGRLLALIIAILSLNSAFSQGLLPRMNMDFLTSLVQNIVPEVTNMINQVQLFDCIL
jgi:uncharacterized membrane protein